MACTASVRMSAGPASREPAKEVSQGKTALLGRRQPSRQELAVTPGIPVVCQGRVFGQDRGIRPMNKRTLLLAAVVVLAVSCAASGSSRKSVLDWTYRVNEHEARSPVIVFLDDMEAGENGWTHVDNTAGAGTKFHLDSYYAYEGAYSWWCGELDAGYSSGDGYDNGWDQRLLIPETDLTGATYPVLTFAYRYDSEPTYDFTYVQAESLGVYLDLGPGYTGSSGGWQDLGEYGYLVGTYDNPLNVRFRFVSDGFYSDADGLYDSDGGGIMLDNIKIFDFYRSTVYFFDDGETGGLCIPEIPGAAGDYWHIADRACAAYSDPHVWWCGDDSDTSLVPPNLNNALISPAVSLVGSTVCTLRLLLHAEVPTVDNDFWTEHLTFDGGLTWYSLGSWWGDFAQCDGWGTHGINGIDLSPYLPGTDFQFRLTFYTTDNGCGPGEGGGAGIMLDDIWIEDWTDTPVVPMSWGRVKALYR